MIPFTIRRAAADDAPTLLRLIRALAEYEKLPPPDAEAEARLVEHGFGPQPRFEAWLAEAGSGGERRAVAYAIAFETYSTFLARPTLWLEDLFVVPDARRQGIGTALLRHLAAEAARRGCGRMEWAVLDWNERAQAAYIRAGAQVLPDWRICRLDADALRSLAGFSGDAADL